MAKYCTICVDKEVRLDPEIREEQGHCDSCGHVGSVWDEGNIQYSERQPRGFRLNFKKKPVPQPKFLGMRRGPRIKW